MELGNTVDSFSIVLVATTDISFYIAKKHTMTCDWAGVVCVASGITLVLDLIGLAQHLASGVPLTRQEFGHAMAGDLLPSIVELYAVCRFHHERYLKLIPSPTCGDVTCGMVLPIVCGLALNWMTLLDHFHGGPVTTPYALAHVWLSAIGPLVFNCIALFAACCFIAQRIYAEHLYTPVAVTEMV